MNVDFEINNTRINARVSAIIYNKDKTKILPKSVYELVKNNTNEVVHLCNDIVIK